MSVSKGKLIAFIISEDNAFIKLEKHALNGYNQKEFMEIKKIQLPKNKTILLIYRIRKKNKFKVGMLKIKLRKFSRIEQEFRMTKNVG